MSVLRAANTWTLNIIVALCVLIFVIFLPLIDRSICKKLGLSLNHGLSTNPRADKLLRWRQFVLFVIFAMYLTANLYLVFVSREESEAYLVHTDLMMDLANSVSFDLGLFGTFEEMLVSGFQRGWDHIHVVKSEDIMQVLMNIALYIPMGYLLPYCFKRFRSRKKSTVFVCFLLSFITENIQLIFKRGTYDLDDLLFNTLGGLIGYSLYKTFAYYVTNPGWRKELRLFHRWQRRSHRKPLPPIAEKIHSGRTIIYTSDFAAASAFYADRLGFRLMELQKFEDAVCSGLMQIGEVEVELRALDNVDFYQQLFICVDNINKVRKRLTKADIPVSDFATDIFTDHRKIEISAPDYTTIVFSE